MGWASHVGGNKAAGGSSTFSLAVPVAVAVAAGRSVILALSGTGTIAAAGGSITDSAPGSGNLYYLEYAFTSGFRPVEFWRADNVTALTTSDVITASYGSTGQTAGITALADAFTGIGSHDCQAGQTISTSGNSNSFSLATTSADVTVYAACFVAGSESSMSVAAPLTAAGAYVNASTSNDAGLAAQKNAPASGGITVNFTWPTGHGSNAAAIGFPSPAARGAFSGFFL
jgi:hypothetical protein